MAYINGQEILFSAKVTGEGGESGEVTLEEKTLEVTENGTTEITPSSGYDGIGKVTITTNVPTYITVASEADLPTDSADGTIAIVG